MAQSQPGSVDKKVLKDAESLWKKYVDLTKKTIIFIVIVLAFLAYFFV